MRKIDGAIITTTTNNNYGNIIQRWALQKFLKNNGYNFISYYFYGYYIKRYLIRQTILFAPLRKLALMLKGKSAYGVKSSSTYNYSAMSKFCNERICQQLFVPGFIKKYGTYIIGSDQNLNYKVIGHEFFCSWKNFLLGFVKWPAKRISYASSFGTERMPEKSPVTGREARGLMKKFDAVSVREKSGIKIAEDIWGVEAREVVDPTILLDVDEYLELIKNPVRKLDKAPRVFYYILRDDNEETLCNFARATAKQLGKKVGGIVGYNRLEMPAVEQWLKGFSEANFVVTDSFHGTIFSIINHTDFVTIRSKRNFQAGSHVRHENLLQKLGLSGRVVREEDFAEFYVKKLPRIDWRTVDRKLNALRRDSQRWLLDALGGAK